MRIIGGRYRGRPLKAPRGRETRPTTDRVREAIFNMLGDVPSGVRALDLFAGSGAMGLEAISRGSAGATFVDSSREACRTIADNAAALGVREKCRIMEKDVMQFLAASEGRGGVYSLVFLDPPYGAGFPREVLEALVSWPGLADPAIVVVETERAAPGTLEESAVVDEKLAPLRTRVYANTAVLIYRWSTGGES